MSNERHEFSHGENSFAERRSSERVTSVYRPVLIETEDFVGFCLVRNLSPGGLMGSAFAEFTEGQPISVMLNSDLTVSGAVTWSKDGKIGIHFDQEIVVDQVLQRLSEKNQGDQINRAPRLAIECDGSLEIEEATYSIKLRDISQRGIKAEIADVKVGDVCVVKLPGLEPRKAVVRWTQGGLAGLNFVAPLAFEQLALWAIDRQEVASD